MNVNKIKDCRFCFLSISEEGNELISPCKCAGYQKYIHRRCLDKWRRNKFNKEQYFKCEICLENYKIGILSNNVVVQTIRFIYFKIGKFEIRNFFYYMIFPLIFSLFKTINFNKFIVTNLSYGLYLNSIIFLLYSLILNSIIYLNNAYEGRIYNYYQYFTDSTKLNINHLLINSFLNLMINCFNFFNNLLYDYSNESTFLILFINLFFLIFSNIFTQKILVNFSFEYFLKKDKEILGNNYSYENNNYVGHLSPISEPDYHSIYFDI